MSKKNWLRGIGIILGVVFLLWFLAPYMIAGILNIGNITGIILSVLLIVYATFATVVHKWIKRLWSRRITKVPVAFVGGIGILCAILVVVESLCMIGASMKHGTDCSTAIVLGCRVYGERASLSMVERLEAAYDYLIEHPCADCVVSGGQGEGEDISEAECMYRWLVDKGIDPSRIYKEEQSTSTEENIAFSQKVIDENGLFQKVVIISNDYHLYRAGMIANDNGMVWGAKAGKTAGWLFPTFYVRELYAILVEWVFD